jgi:ATP-GRASP peptide maturase of grasp-with-spasm system
MILIVSHTELDLPTDLVFSWVLSLGERCLRLNGTDLVQQQTSFSIKKNSLQGHHPWQSEYLDVNEVTAVWNRRWIQSEYFKGTGSVIDHNVFLKLLRDNNFLRVFENKEQEDQFQEMIVGLINEFSNQKRSEFKAFSHYLNELLLDIPALGSSFYSGKDPSKALQIKVAREVGLDVPDTIITNSKADLLKFSIDYKNIICKNISEIAILYYYKMHITYTSVVTPELVELLPDNFFLSLFQEAIDKEFEIRSFYLNKKIYSMAIFSSQDKQTAIDFRVYNADKPNRNVPFNLPSEIESKIIAFMERLQLDTGSLDLIYSTAGEYIFLEVNPVGQFGMVSVPCNYSLEKLVAEHLIEISTKCQNITI